MKPNKDEIIVAFDKATVRSFDKDGRMRVSISRISKADVNPYWGREIVGGDELGLDPDRVYNVLRPPEELEKAAATFNTLPILLVHKHVSADDPKNELIIGTTGSNAAFDGQYLTNDLAIWDGEYIEKIKSEEQRELSSSYRYKPVIKSGTYNGAQYDIVMTEIIGNHVALVVEGRAGPEVTVADSQIQPPEKVRTVKLNPKQKAALKVRLPKLKVAMDEGIDTAGVEEALEEALEEVQALGEPAAAVDDGNAEIADLLKQLLAKFEGKPAGAADEDEAAKKAAADEAARAEEAKKAEEAKSASAMDAKIKAAADGARQSIEGRFRAADKVAPITGRIDAMAFDSAEAIYAHALKICGMDPEKHEKVAYAGIVDVLLDTRSKTPVHVAHDAAGDAELLKQFPALAKINHA
ncbi:DUF2213 domain-containing protein [Burkholderia thailandensis]|uniref:DUF2213 domain-containing protein n=1 Tax=Burkholderia thailandensis TaxID=57975 RepID=UPI0013786A8A|nr:DUF2213 domain-containing protein [Burkholderia thailandensis]ALJ98684.2 RNA polymerase sigma factor [Burkholderia phage PE067]MCS6455947.1 DUF2213 domain-containing protein [Burkholderia thailandensis]MCS6482662.1 DUF2213 domain-containing protein [Burkholderia thailandensis]NBD02172.1 DUF2213 domain-containing protein [Burkholderia thailandensis]NOK53468.1 hypothetical protein [Burkholderia thailandensis]